MARFHLISPHLWRDAKVRGWDDGTFRVAMYLLTGPHKSSEGLYWLPPAYIAADLGWPLEKVTAALNELIEQGFIEIDPEAEVVFVCKSLKYQPPNNEKQVKGALNKLAELPSHSLTEAFMEAAEEFAPQLHEALLNGYRRP